MLTLFAESLFLFGCAAVGVVVAIVVKIILHQVIRILIRQKRIDFNGKLLPIEILIRDIISHITRSTCSCTEAEAKRDHQNQGRKRFSHSIAFPFFS